MIEFLIGFSCGAVADVLIAFVLQPRPACDIEEVKRLKAELRRLRDEARSRGDFAPDFHRGHGTY